MIRIEDIDEMIELVKEFTASEIDMLKADTFERGGYYMVYQIIDALERMKEHSDVE